MKKIILPFACVLSITAMAQTTPNTVVNPFPKTITVSGSAEMEVIPDQVFVQIELREYQKKNEDKKDIETIKTQFLEACRSSGLPDSIISVVAFSGSNSYYSMKKNRKKNPELFSGITYQVKFSTNKQMDDLVEKLDDDATRNFQIVSSGHSKMTTFRKQLKIQAIQAAKEKGIYLTEAIGEKLGAAITIKEPDEEGTYVRSSNVSNMMSQSVYKPAYESDKSFDISFKEIKVRFVVNIIFALQ